MAREGSPKTRFDPSGRRRASRLGERLNLDDFLKQGEVDDSEIMYDFYESKGWKIGRNSMKCWKSATRNWVRRSKKDNLKL